jgi:TetR/AcrR family transcriptional regulator, regulator of cefoperazone and chloramphenicol sensitivity
LNALNTGKTMDDTRQKLLDAAGEVFAAKGYEAATVREICAAAGMNVAAVNYHFGDKEKLYLEAIRAAECAGGVPPNYEWPTGTPPEQKLRDFIHRMVMDMLDVNRPTWHAQLLMRAMFEPTRACEELVRDFIAPKFEILGRVIDEVVGGELDPRERHLYAFSIVGQCLLYRFHQPVGRLLVGDDEFRFLSSNLELLAEHITRFSLSALRCVGNDDAPRAPVKGGAR